MFFWGVLERGRKGLRILTNVCMWVVDTIRDGVALKNTQIFRNGCDRVHVSALSDLVIY